MAYQSYRSAPYKPGQKTSYKLSRSKIELFKQCPRCFWLDVRLKIGRPSSPPFNINKAIDELFKKEFDSYRKKKEPHPIMIEGKVDAIPFAHKDLDTWRANFTGVSTIHEPTNLYIFGAVDDVWVNKDDELIVVDYKATAKATEVGISSPWQISYKRQLEVYQWLLRQNGFKVSETGYFVYTNARMDLDAFNDSLTFVTKLIPYKGNDSWIDKTLIRMKDCMDSETMPPVGDAAMGGPCEFCSYARSRTELTLDSIKSKSTPKKQRP
jgi:CRISPR/Cas system-associated exonuclease Cas4 (RecB family)